MKAFIGFIVVLILLPVITLGLILGITYQFFMAAFSGGATEFIDWLMD